MKLLIIFLGLVYLTNNWPNFNVHDKIEYEKTSFDISRAFGLIFGLITLYYIAEYIEQVI